jgi:hypothetical protein
MVRPPSNQVAQCLAAAGSHYGSRHSSAQGGRAGRRSASPGRPRSEPRAAPTEPPTSTPSCRACARRAVRRAYGCNRRQALGEDAARTSDRSIHQDTRRQSDHSDSAARSGHFSFLLSVFPRRPSGSYVEFDDTAGIQRSRFTLYASSLLVAYSGCPEA